jgi:hypothetical protein
MKITLAFRWLAVCFAMAVLAFALTGCISPRFEASYYLDPKPARVAYDDLVPPVTKQPVYLVFDMYSAEGSFPEATRKLGPKVARVIANSGMFSTISKVGSENMARIQISMRETGVHSGQDIKKLPQGLSSGLAGSRGVISYSFTMQFQVPGKDLVKKEYPHAVHLVEGDTTGFGSALPMTAGHAVDGMVEQAVLKFLKDLQTERKL